MIFKLLIAANRLYCRVMFRVGNPIPPPLPMSGPVLLVSDHTSLTDPLVLFATAGRPIRFLMAREFYALPVVNWISKLYGNIPVSRSGFEVGPVRAMLHALAQGDVVGIFPEGGIDKHRKEEGYDGIGFVALKSGTPVVPVSIAWDRPRPSNLLRAMVTPARATVRYGAPLVLGAPAGRTRGHARAATDRILQAIRDLPSQAPNDIMSKR
ncbi:MAG: lysophospholipid acyltransferase family protein [Nitrospirales bacterium]|nr:lysophospholipid acyltransferase family protein [Nitrospirales bacterium]